MRTTQIFFVLATLFLTQSVMAQGQGNGPPPPPGDVNVINTPDVNVANVPDVVIANTPLDAVPMVPGGEPFQENKFDLVPSGQSLARNIFGPVPAGKRLHIEHASARAVINNTLNLNLRCSIGIIQPGLPNTSVMSHSLVVEMSPGQFADTHVASTPITLFAEAGQEVWFDCFFGPSNPGPSSQSVSAAISGFLVDL